MTIGAGAHRPQRRCGPAQPAAMRRGASMPSASPLTIARPASESACAKASASRTPCGRRVAAADDRRARGIQQFDASRDVEGRRRIADVRAAPADTPTRRRARRSDGRAALEPAPASIVDELARRAGAQGARPRAQSATARRRSSAAMATSALTGRSEGAQQRAATATRRDEREVTAMRASICRGEVCDRKGSGRTRRESGGCPINGLRSRRADRRAENERGRGPFLHAES